MNSFNFGRKVEICGEIYYLKRDMEAIAKAMKKCSDKMIELSQKKDITQEEMMGEVTTHSKEAIDTALGEGSYDRIFAQEEPDLINLVDLVDFITGEINQWKKELMAKKIAGEELLKKRGKK